jgi:hypothetical protein
VTYARKIIDDSAIRKKRKVRWFGLTGPFAVGMTKTSKVVIRFRDTTQPSHAEGVMLACSDLALYSIEAVA